MAKKNIIPSAPHRIGLLAGELAEKARLLRELTRTALLEKAAGFRDSIQEIAEWRLEFKSFILIMTVCWAAVMAWEFLISQEFYVDLVGAEARNSMLRFLPPVALFLLAMLLSALIAEPFHPIISRFLAEHKEKGVEDEFLRPKFRLKAQWLMFLAGIAGSALLLYFVYQLSLERVQLLMAAGEAGENNRFQELLPAVLLGCEIVTGIFVIYFVQILHYWTGSKVYERRIRGMEEKIRMLEFRVWKTWDAYRLAMLVHNRKYNVDDPIIAPSPALQEILYRRESPESAPSNGQDAAASPQQQDSETPESPAAPEQSNPAASGNGGYRVSAAHLDLSPSAAETISREAELLRLLDEQNRRNNREL